MKIATFLSLFVGIVGTTSLVQAQKGTPSDRGKAIYDSKCSQCHGETGDGKGVGADGFRPLPRDFTLGIYKIHSTPSGELPTREDLKRVIRKGMPYTGMPAWPQFSDDEVEDIVTYLQSFSSDFADTSVHAEHLVIPKIPEFNSANLAEGRKIFEANKCFDCHGQQGRGDGETAPTLSDDWGYPIRPANLNKPWAFRGGASREDLFRTISTGLNGTPMASFAKDIPVEDRWKLIDYLQSLSPTGSQAPYSITVVAKPVAKIDWAQRDSLFVEATASLFPVVGQVLEDPRCYASGVNAIQVRAVYDSLTIAFQLKWHDMTAETQGNNSPIPLAVDTTTAISDAVAMQFAAKPIEGNAKPFFLMGDKKLAADLWFVDLAQTQSGGPSGFIRNFIAKGSNDFRAGDDTLPIAANYHQGEWTLILTHARKGKTGERFARETFIPMAFSVWDGSLKETGRKHGVTSWYNLYLQAPATESPWVPTAKAGALAMVIQLLVVWGLRHTLRRNS